MNPSYMLRAAAFLLIVLCAQTITAFAQQSFLDRQIPSEARLRASLEIAKRLASKPSLNASQILQIYTAENVIGRFVWALPEEYAKSFPWPLTAARRDIRDTMLTAECLSYVRKYRHRFQIVSDEWKGEDNFVEPDSFWLKQVIALDPRSAETVNIEFDIDFKTFVRRIEIDLDAKGKTSQEYFAQFIKSNADTLNYSQEEINTWPTACDSARAEFIRCRELLLQKYKRAPFTRILQNIDSTTVIVHFFDTD